MKKNLKIWWINVILVSGFLFLILSYFSFLFLILGILSFSFPLLYVFAKGLENVVMVKEIKGSELREGDWLVDDIKVGKRIIKADFEGLSLSDIKLLKRRSKVKIKEGLPFVPAFLLAFLQYVFLKSYIFSFVGLS